jgi:hypothetical protein
MAACLIHRYRVLAVLIRSCGSNICCAKVLCQGNVYG